MSLETASEMEISRELVYWGAPYRTTPVRVLERIWKQKPFQKGLGRERTDLRCRYRRDSAEPLRSSEVGMDLHRCCRLKLGNHEFLPVQLLNRDYTWVQLWVRGFLVLRQFPGRNQVWREPIVLEKSLTGRGLRTWQGGEEVPERHTPRHPLQWLQNFIFLFFSTIDVLGSCLWAFGIFV